MGLVVRDDSWRIPDELWNQMELLLPPGKLHPLGCHNPRAPNRNRVKEAVIITKSRRILIAMLGISTNQEIFNIRRCYDGSIP